MEVSRLRKLAGCFGDNTCVLVCRRRCRGDNLGKIYVNVYMSFLSFLVQMDAVLRCQLHLCGGMAVLFLGYENEPPNSANGSPFRICGSAFCFTASRNFSRSRMAVSASRSSFSLFLSASFFARPMRMRSFDFLCKQYRRRAASKARKAKPPKTPPTIAPTGRRVALPG